jgi:hypothetical protein
VRNDEKLVDLGFKNILQINRVMISGSIHEKKKMVQIRVKSIFGEASIETLCYLRLHLEHFINHHIENNVGVDKLSVYYGDDYTVLEYDAEADPDVE